MSGSNDGYIARPVVLTARLDSLRPSDASSSVMVALTARPIALPSCEAATSIVSVSSSRSSSTTVMTAVTALAPAGRVRPWGFASVHPPLVGV